MLPIPGFVIGEKFWDPGIQDSGIAISSHGLPAVLSFGEGLTI